MLLQGLHFYPDLASTLQGLSVDTLFDLIGQEFEKVAFSCYAYNIDIIGYMIIRRGMSGDIFGGKHAL